MLRYTYLAPLVVSNALNITLTACTTCSDIKRGICILQHRVFTSLVCSSHEIAFISLKSAGIRLVAVMQTGGVLCEAGNELTLCLVEIRALCAGQNKQIEASFKGREVKWWIGVQPAVLSD
jgi:hypothetical protein